MSEATVSPGACVGVGVAVAGGTEVDSEPQAAATKPKTSIREIHPALLTNVPHINMPPSQAIVHR